MYTAPTSRETYLQLAFSEVPQKVGPYQLRPLSAGSYSLLMCLECPLFIGLADLLDEAQKQQATFEGAILYIWVHAAPLEEVIAIRDECDLDREEIAKIAFNLGAGDVLAFLDSFARGMERMSATMAEPEPEENDHSGKLQAWPPAGSPPSSSPSAVPETPCESGTSCGLRPSSAPSPTSTPPTSPEEPAAGGAWISPLTSPQQEQSPNWR